jgi:uncharacterized protein (TIGR00645 family)
MSLDSFWKRNFRSVEQAVGEVIFKSRYLLVPLYLMMLWGLVTITYDCGLLMLGRVHAEVLTEHTLQILEMLDRTMVANLVWLISAGSFVVFVATYRPSEVPEDRPRSLAHISTGILKEKMAGSIVGVSSISLLTLFLHVTLTNESVDWSKVGALIAIHAMFIFGLLAFNYTNAADHLTHNGEKEKPHDK